MTRLSLSFCVACTLSFFPLPFPSPHTSLWHISCSSLSVLVFPSFNWLTILVLSFLLVFFFCSLFFYSARRALQANDRFDVLCWTLLCVVYVHVRIREFILTMSRFLYKYPLFCVLYFSLASLCRLILDQILVCRLPSSPVYSCRHFLRLHQDGGGTKRKLHTTTAVLYQYKRSRKPVATGVRSPRDGDR